MCPYPCRERHTTSRLYIRQRQRSWACTPPPSIKRQPYHAAGRQETGRSRRLPTKEQGGMQLDEQHVEEMLKACEWALKNWKGRRIVRCRPRPAPTYPPAPRPRPPFFPPDRG